MALSKILSKTNPSRSSIQGVQHFLEILQRFCHNDDVVGEIKV